MAYVWIRYIGRTVVGSNEKTGSISSQGPKYAIIFIYFLLAIVKDKLIEIAINKIIINIVISKKTYKSN